MRGGGGEGEWDDAGMMGRERGDTGCVYANVVYNKEFSMEVARLCFRQPAGIEARIRWYTNTLYSSCCHA